MRLSETILLGLLDIKFTNESWYYKNSNGDCEGCLVGAALRSMGVQALTAQEQGEKMRLGFRESEWPPLEDFRRIWPWVKEFDSNLKNKAGVTKILPCPFCSHNTISDFGVPSLLTHLANHYINGKVTADQIADTIRQMEPNEEPENPVLAELHSQSEQNVEGVSSGD